VGHPQDPTQRLRQFHDQIMVLLWFPSVLPRLACDAGHGKEKPPQGDGIRLPWAALSVLFAVLVGGGLLGWWATEILYAQRVIYSYDAMGAVGK
jgi:hypothetical protein